MVPQNTHILCERVRWAHYYCLSNSGGGSNAYLAVQAHLLSGVVRHQNVYHLSNITAWITLADIRLRDYHKLCLRASAVFVLCILSITLEKTPFFLLCVYRLAST